MKKPQTLEEKYYLFGEAPVFRALMTLAIPTVLSQLVTMIYNMADTFFVGKSNDPLKVAAVSSTYVVLFFMNAIANLFGIGGGSLISRLLGQRREDEARRVSAFSFVGSVVFGALYIGIVMLFEDAILYFLGATGNTIGFCREYVKYVVLFGGLPTVVSLTLSHLLRNEGRANEASFGLAFGGILNMLLDPLFMFVILPKGQEVQGAAVATALSNTCSLVYFLYVVRKNRAESVLSLRPNEGMPERASIRSVFAVGLPSMIATGMAAFSNMYMTHLAKACGATTGVVGDEDVYVAAVGLVKKVDMLPMNTGMGLCQGMIPLVAYNYASGNYKRMKQFMRAARYTGIAFALLCVASFEIFSEPIMRFFIDEGRTVSLAARLLRFAVIATPTTVTAFQLNYSFQAIGHGMESLLFAIFRQGLFNIPLMILFSRFWSADGIMIAQFVSDIFTLILSFALWHYRVEKKLPKPDAAQAAGN